MRQQKNIFLGLVTIILFTSCSNPKGENTNLYDSLDPVEKVSLLNGNDDVTIVVNKKDDAYFSLIFSNIKNTNVIDNGVREGWCIDWQKNIDSNNKTYNGIKLYSTYNVEKWKALNYLLNIKDDLVKEDTDLSWREIQVAIWSLRANPEFDLDKISVADLPSDMQSNGKANFSYDKVREILDIVNSGYQNFNFSVGSKFAVIAETPADVQTVITVVQKK